MTIEKDGLKIIIHKKKKFQLHTWASNGFFEGAKGGDTVNKGSYAIK